MRMKKKQQLDTPHVRRDELVNTRGSDPGLEGRARKLASQVKCGDAEGLEMPARRPLRRQENMS